MCCWSFEKILETAHLEDPADIWTYFNTMLQHSSCSFKSYCLSEFKNVKKHMEEGLPNFIAHLEECYHLVTEAGESKI